LRLIFVVPPGVPVWALKLTVTVPLPFTDEGLKFACTPAGSPLAERETLPVKPPTEVMVTLTVGFVPGVNMRLAGLTEIVKSGRVITVKLMVVLIVVEPLVPVMVMGTGDAGTVAFAAAVKVRVLIPDPPVIDAGLNAAVIPDGNPVTLSVTVPEN